jgi:hypothetical protein
MGMTLAEMEAKLAKLEAENNALKAKNSGKLSFKVSTKGAVSVYGLGRFPVTLYETGWNRVLDAADDIRKFISVNSDKLSKGKTETEIATS